MRRYDPKEIEPKWAGIWDETGVYTTDLNSSKPKYIGMSMFNYPSGAGIHIGHAMNYTISDVKARFKRQQGYESYHPVGWDAFGLPAENYAIKTGVSPQESMATIIPGYHKQYKAMGWSNDWEKEISTHLPEYYKWSQWVFAEMYRRGLVYQDSRMQWWCPIDNTVLANEQVIDGKCWRHDGANDPPATKKEIKQWFFKITDYADELLEATDELDWTESVKLAQKNWIGRSSGAEIKFLIPRVDDFDDSYKITEYIDFNQPAKELYYLSAGKPHRKIGEYFQVGNRQTKELTGIARITSAKTLKFGDLPKEQQEGISKYEPEHKVDTVFTRYEYEIAAEVATVFTTRADTIFGATFLVLAPEHELVQQITTKEQKKKVDEYVKKTLAKSELERQESKQKTGVFTGAYAINPATGGKIPIWIADYVLTGYGTGAIMAVPAHDERDNEFARKFDLPIQQVVAEVIGDMLDNAINVDGTGIIGYDKATKKYLFLRNNKNGLLWMAAGGCNKGESYEQTAKRELHEEAGYKNIDKLIPIGDVFCTYYFNLNKKSNRRATSQDFIAYLDGSQDIDQHNEAHEDYTPVWLDYNEAIKGLNNTGKHTYVGHWLRSLELAHMIVGGQTVAAFHGEGILIDSGEYTGMSTSQAREKIVKDLAKKGAAKEVTNYRMRDWSVSRQRYWGAPIPIIYCEKCGPQLVPDEDLPVILPELTDFTPTGDGRGPLARAKDWLKVDCPKCHGPAERETDTLDTYVDSSFYMYRYLDPRNQEAIFDSKVANKWAPIDFYNGGDHATAHMLYARFVTRFFNKIGLVDNPEPFKQFLFNGKVTAADGTMFSKSKGNGVDPLEIIDQGYGADALRTYLMFAAPLELWPRWDPQGVPGTYRFLNRLWNLVQEFDDAKPAGKNSDDVLRAAHKMIKKVTEDIEANRYNTAIAAMMECVNDLYKLRPVADNDNWRQALESLIACVAPFAPFIADELWQQLGHSSSVHKDTWPKWDEKYLTSDTLKIAVQVNGKLRGQIEIPADTTEADAASAAKQNSRVSEYLAGKNVIKTIYIPGKIVNFVV